MYDSDALTGLIAVLGGFIIILGIAIIAWAIFYIIGVFKLFEKAGQPGWKAIIPYYNNWTLVEIVGLEWYWFLLLLVPTILSLLGLDSLVAIGNIVNIVANVNIFYNLSKKFNKSTGWVVLSVFFGFITLPILGYSKTEVWNAAAPVTPNGLFDTKNASTAQSNPTQQVTPQPMNNAQTVVTPQPMDNNQTVVTPQPTVTPEQPNVDVNNTNNQQ